MQLARNAVLFLILVAAAQAATAQSRPEPTQPKPNTPEQVEAHLKALLTDFLDAAGRGESKVFERFFADDLIYTRGTGATTTKEEILKSVRLAENVPNPDRGRITYRAEDVQMRQYRPDLAVVNFRLVEMHDGRRHAEYRNTGTFLRRGGVWQAIAWQATPLQRQTGQASLDEIRYMDRQFHEGMLNADFDAIEHITTDDFIFVHSSGRVEPRAELLARMEKQGKRYARISTENQQVQSYPHAAIVRGTSERQYAEEGAKPFRTVYTSYFVRLPTTWLLAAVHMARVSEPERKSGE